MRDASKAGRGSRRSELEIDLTAPQYAYPPKQHCLAMSFAVKVRARGCKPPELVYNYFPGQINEWWMN
jgi:hypothetical protein